MYSVSLSLPLTTELPAEGSRTRATSSRDPSEFASILEIQDTYKIKVLSAKNANTPENLKVSVLRQLLCIPTGPLTVQVYVKAGIYHGREPLCAVVTTSKGAGSETSKGFASEGTEWNEILEFDISIRDIPRGAKLSFIVFAAPER